MKKTIIFSAPYMMTSVERFRKVLEGHYGLEMIVPDVKQKLLEDDIISYAGKFDGTICGDDEYSARVIEACSPRLKVVSKWGTGIDAIDKEACRYCLIKKTIAGAATAGKISTKRLFVR